MIPVNGPQEPTMDMIPRTIATIDLLLAEPEDAAGAGAV
jgi:hypothetical protein